MRAKYQKTIKTDFNLLRSRADERSETQIFLQTYAHLEKQGALDSNAIFEVAVEMTKEKVEQQRAMNRRPEGLEVDVQGKAKLGLLEEFSKVQPKAEESPKEQ